MSIHDLLPLYALGALDDDEAREVERALAADPSLARALATYHAAASELASALHGVSPSASVKARLLASTASRFERFVQRFTELFEVTAARARELLAQVDQPTAWEPGPAPGAWLIHFQAGPSLVGADAGFVKLDPGARFAWHRHAGREHNLVLQGRAIDTMLGDIGPGDEGIGEPGSAHDFTTTSAEPLIFAVWVWGVDFDVPRPA